MENNNLKIIEDQDDYIQSLSIDRLHEMEKNSKFLFQNDMSLKAGKNLEDLKYDNIDIYIQNLQLEELKELETNSHLLEKTNEVDLQHKVKLTGLKRDIILLIETKKEKATLEQILTYCNTLHVPYNQILPELFTQTAC